jgi:dihydropteroate synthase
LISEADSARRFGGVLLDRPRVMGIVNVTPDSFSERGATFAHDAAIAHGLRLIEDGADIVDVGGESTRPGATPVGFEEEIRRIEPVVQALADAGATVSIDTRHAAVMRAALKAGARIVNDVSALAGEADSLGVAATSNADIVLMHMPGDPQTMGAQRGRYGDVVEEVFAYLHARVAACEAAGIARGRIAVDPGFGFGKDEADNLRLLNGLARFRDLGRPILVGLSRKFGKGKPPQDRLAESLGLARRAVANGADIVRAHDVAETVAALARP